MSNHAPPILKVAAKRPEATSPIKELPVSRLTKRKITAQAPSDARNDTSLREKKPTPKTREASAYVEK